MAASEARAFAEAVSLVLGWTYFVTWSISFYPQGFVNYARKSTIGVAIDFSAANIVGMSAYTIYTAALSFSPEIRHEYALRHGGVHMPAVRVNDFVFGLHGLLVVLFIFTQFWPQIWGFKVGKDQRISTPMWCLCGASIAVVLSTVAAVLLLGDPDGIDPDRWMWLDVIYSLGYVKLFLTIVKYSPQAWVMYKRKTTAGFAIEGVQLDVLGGVLSIAQLFIDSGLDGDWSGVTGNPAKFALGNISLVYDALFLFQHYVLYRKARKDVECDARPADEIDPLLGHSLR